MLLALGLFCAGEAALAQIALRASASGSLASSTLVSITHVAAGAAASAASGNVTPTLPAHQTDDLLVCAVSSNDTTAHSVATSGWTQLYQVTTNPRSSLFYKKALSSSETNPTVTHTAGGGIVAGCSAFRGVDTTTPFDVTYNASHTSRTTNTNVTSGSMTTVSANAMMLFVGHVANNRCNLSTSVTGGLTWSQSFCRDSTLSLDESVALHYATLGTPGAIGPITFTHTGSDNNQGVLIALRPGSPGSGLSVNKPSGTVDGDVMVASVAVRPDTVSITAPSGWTQVQSLASSNTGAESVLMTTWTKVAASEGASYTWTFGASHTGAVGAISTYTGVDNTTPVDASGSNTTTSAFTHTANSITTATASTMLVASYAFPSITNDWTAPSGMGEAVDVASTTRPSTAGVSMEVAYLTRTSTGATGSFTASASSTGTDAGFGVAHLLALKPAAVTLTCYTDSFTGSDGASPGSAWATTSTSGSYGVPKIYSNRLRLTDNVQYGTTGALLQRSFPSSSNKLIIEFDHYAYDTAVSDNTVSTGANGLAAVISDATTTLNAPTIGGSGNSLGYAQTTGVNGFSGGWLGIGLDEDGNFASSTEGRSGGAGKTTGSVTVRGSGSGTTGYAYHTNSGTLSPKVDRVFKTITFVGAGTAAAVNGGNVTPTLPSHQTDDFLLCVATSNDTVAHTTTTSGWTQRYQVTTTPSSSMFYKFATSSAETSPTITHSGGSGIVANCSAFRNVNTVGDPFMLPNNTSALNQVRTTNSTLVMSGQAGGSTSALQVPMVIFMGHVDNNKCDLTVSNAGGLSWNQAFCSDSTLGADETVAMHYALLAQPADYAGPATFSHAQNDNNLGVLDTLRPARAGHRYRITLDNYDNTHAYLTVDRDIGAGYVNIVPQYDVRAQSGQSSPPTSWLLSFTATTNAAVNNHEIDNLSVCTPQAIQDVGLHHVRLNHSGSSVVCQGEQVTVYACNAADSNGSCTASTTGLTGNVIAKNTGGTTIATVPFTIASGSSSSSAVTLSVTSGQTVTLDTSGLSATPSSTPATTCWNGSAASCSNTFSDTGFIFTTAADGSEISSATWGATSFTAGTASGSYYLRAVKTNTTTRACESALGSGNTAVQFAYECVNPTSCYTSNLLTVNGGSGSTTVAGYGSGLVSTGTDVTMNFNGTGNAPFTFNYSDAGKIRLYATKPASGSLLTALTGSTANSFVVKPAGFTLSATCADGTANSASQSAPGTGDNRFCRAGASFSGTVTAITNNSGSTAYNYGRETTPEIPTVSLARHLPTGTGTSAGNPASATLSKTAGYTGAFTGSGMSWDEVGILAATINDSDYLGAGSVTSTAYLGRFYPDHFNTTLSAQCGGFAYSGRPETTVVTGQPFTATATAKNVGGNTTANYSSASGWAKAVNLSVTTGASAGTLYTDTTASGSGAIPASKFTNPGIGTAAYTDASGKLSFVFGTYPSGSTPIVLHAEDADTSTGTTLLAATDSGIDIRAGRLWLGNAYGSDRNSVALPYEFQYWNGNAFVKNTADTCSSIASTTYLGLGNYKGTLTSSTLGLAKFSIGANGGGGGTITVTSPTAAAAGSLDIAFALGSTTTTNTSFTPTVAPTVGRANAWLRGKWYGANYDRDPTAHITFGIAGSNQRKGPLYLRESY